MKDVPLVLIIFVLICSSCYKMKPDGTPDIPIKKFSDIKGRWIGFNENNIISIRLDIYESGKGKFVYGFFDKVTEEYDCSMTFKSNILKVSVPKIDKSEKEPTIFTFNYEPTFKMFECDQKLGDIDLKITLIPNEKFQEKLKKLYKKSK